MYDHLQFATHDADAFQEYLMNDLAVPDINMINLRDEEASREAIIQAFRTLRDDVRIVPNEAAIVIYFAGHGGRVRKPAGEEWAEWESKDDHIEILCPSDLGMMIPSKDGTPKKVAGIPDRTVSVLLNELSASKGNNIVSRTCPPPRHLLSLVQTLILDCCSSAGINRSVPEEDEGAFRPRVFMNPPPISSDCDRNILVNEIRSASIAQGFSGRYHQSHVLLAACGRDQSAYEYSAKKHGLFTHFLLRALRKYNVDELTYSSLMHKLRIPMMPKDKYVS